MQAKAYIFKKEGHFKMARKKIIAGNWKMNKTPSEAVALVNFTNAIMHFVTFLMKIFYFPKSLFIVVYNLSEVSL